jgi:hypothetical protein
MMAAAFPLAGQSVLISDDPASTAPDASAILEVESSAYAMLFPRLSLAEIDAIALPAEGLMLYDTDDNKMVYYDGSDWLFFDGTLVVFSKKKSAPLPSAGEGDQEALKDSEHIATGGDAAVRMKSGKDSTGNITDPEE